MAFGNLGWDLRKRSEVCIPESPTAVSCHRCSQEQRLVIADNVQAVSLEDGNPSDTCVCHNLEGDYKSPRS